MRDEITAFVLTYNEKENIKRTLKALVFLPRVLVVDSYSTDGTVEIAKTFKNVEVLQREFISFAEQCNWGLAQINSEWALSLDADYLLSDALHREIELLPASSEVSGYSARLKYCISGIPLRSSILPPRTILYRRQCATYNDEGHGHRVSIKGRVGDLSGYILHDDRKSLSRWLESQDRYMKIEAPHLLGTPSSQLKFQDRLRKRIFFGPAVMFLYLLLGRGLIFDGWRGWYYVMQRTLAEILLSLRLLIQKYNLEAGK